MPGKAFQPRADLAGQGIGRIDFAAVLAQVGAAQHGNGKGRSAFALDEFLAQVAKVFMRDGVEAGLPKAHLDEVFLALA